MAVMYQSEPPVIPVGPLDLGTILGGTFRVLKRKIGLFAVLSLIPGLILTVTMTAAAVPIIVTVTPLIRNRTTPSAGWFAGVSALIFVAVVVGALAQVKCQGMMSLAAHDLAHGGSPNLTSLWSRTQGLTRRVLALYLVLSVAGLLVAGVFVAAMAASLSGVKRFDSAVAAGITIAFLLLLLVYAGAIFVMIRLLYFLACLAVEGVGAIRALQRSWRLTRGNFWRTFGYYLLASAIVSSIAFMLSSLTQLMMMPIILASTAQSHNSPPDASAVATLPIMIVTSLLQIVVSLLVVPFITTYITLMYVDQVRRSEMGYQMGPYGPSPMGPPPYGRTNHSGPPAPPGWQGPQRPQSDFWQPPPQR